MKLLLNSCSKQVLLLLAAFLLLNNFHFVSMANKSLPISSTTTVLPLLEKFGRFRSLEVMMSNRMQDISTIQREFEQFLKLFNVNIRNTRVNFFHRHGEYRISTYFTVENACLQA